MPASPNLVLHVKITEKNDGSAVTVEYLCNDQDDPKKKYPMRTTHVQGLLFQAAQMIGRESKPVESVKSPFADEED